MHRGNVILLYSIKNEDTQTLQNTQMVNIAIRNSKPRAIKLSVALPVSFNDDKKPWQRLLAKMKEMQDTDPAFVFPRALNFK